jgi:hypothetical protein
MAISQTSTLAVTLSALLADSLDNSTVRDEVSKSYSLSITNGTGASQANQLWHDTRTVLTGATDSLDLAGVLTNGIRQTVTFASIKLVLVKAAAANSTIISVTRPAANGVPIFSAAGDAAPLGPNGVFLWSSPVSGVTVTASTGDLLDIVNAAGASATYDIFIVGVQ